MALTLTSMGVCVLNPMMVELLMLVHYMWRHLDTFDYIMQLALSLKIILECELMFYNLWPYYGTEASSVISTC